jgi:hypothetical protein
VSSDREELEYELQAVIDDMKTAQEDTEIGSVLARAKHDFDELVKRHRAVDPAEFNTDRAYKEMMTEAIESKALVLRKLRLFVELRAAGKKYCVLERIKNGPLQLFADEDAMMELRTGISGFPWAKLKAKEPTVHLGNWTPVGLDASQLDIVVAYLSSNELLRAVTVGSPDIKSFSLGHGWMLPALHWQGLLAVKASISVAALLLRCFTRLECLDLRCAC